MGALKALVAELDAFGFTETAPEDTREIIEAARIITQRHLVSCECGICPPRS